MKIEQACHLKRQISNEKVASHKVKVHGGEGSALAEKTQLITTYPDKIYLSEDIAQLRGSTFHQACRLKRQISVIIATERLEKVASPKRKIYEGLESAIHY